MEDVTWCPDASFRTPTFPRFLLVFSRAELKPKHFLSNGNWDCRRMLSWFKNVLEGAKPGLLASAPTLPPPQPSKRWPRKSHKIKYRSSWNIHERKVLLRKESQASCHTQSSCEKCWVDQAWGKVTRILAMYTHEKGELNCWDIEVFLAKQHAS